MKLIYSILANLIQFRAKKIHYDIVDIFVAGSMAAYTVFMIIWSITISWWFLLLLIIWLPVMFGILAAWQDKKWISLKIYSVDFYEDFVTQGRELSKLKRKHKQMISMKYTKTI